MKMREKSRFLGAFHSRELGCVFCGEVHFSG